MTETHAPAAAPFSARLKHLLATSPASRPLARLRSLRNWPNRLRHPELATLYREDGYIDTLLPRFITPGTNCLDIGAHFGAVSYRMEELSQGGWLGIVEASPWKAALLRRRFATATVFETAVSDEDGTISFYENIDRPGFSSLSDRASRGETREVKVPVARLDTLLSEDTPVGFVKIDVEGHEYAALRGAEALLRRDRPVILFEAGAATDEDLDTTGYVRLFAWLTGELGYDIYAACDLVEGRPALDAEGFERHRVYPFTAFNFFAIPSGSGPETTADIGDQR